MTNTRRAPCKAGTDPEPDGLPPAKQFGDRLTADHKTLMDDQASRGGARYALVIQDEHTRWIQAYATKSRCYPEVVQAFKKIYANGPQAEARLPRQRTGANKSHGRAPVDL